MSSPAINTSCSAFRGLSPEMLRPNAIHRFVVGEDAAVRVLSTEEAARELGDPFATLLLLQGIFPRTAGEVLEALDRMTADGDPLRTGFFFLLGEGSQIPMSATTATIDRGLRFLVARGIGTEGADILLSAFHPDTENVELMAWDRRSGGFNFYRTVGDQGAWVFAGNSRHALSDPTQGKGPFESHLSGNFVMKELRLPWMHWHSQKAPILASVLPPDPPLVGHPWVTGQNPQGAEACERDVAKPGIKRWTKARFAQLLARDGCIEDPGRILSQVLETRSVNLISSQSESRATAPGRPMDLPQTFFVDSEALTEVLGLQRPPRFTVFGDVYRKSLTTLGVRLTDERGFTRPGDTHFAFAVPERAFEDRAVLEQALEVGLLTRRLATCLLMTDFPNPVFSRRRAALLAHVPPSAVIADGRSDFSEQMGDAIAAVAPSTPVGSSEREFAERWNRDDDVESFAEELRIYYATVTERLRTQEGYNDYARLAESRRACVRDMPIFENELLFITTDIPPAAREMRTDGTVVEV